VVETLRDTDAEGLLDGVALGVGVCEGVVEGLKELLGRGRGVTVMSYGTEFIPVMSGDITTDVHSAPQQGSCAMSVHV
jgi:hypothetical protein